MFNNVVSRIMQKMIAESGGQLHDINHFMKVYAFAQTIGVQENLNDTEQETLEIAAILHDIACPLCREKYGNTDGKYQEKEGVPLASAFLLDFNLLAGMTERIVYLVGHHHTYTAVDGLDYQILLEADFLVNADEGTLSKEAIKNAGEHFFKTKTAKDLLNMIYLIEDKERGEDCGLHPSL